MKNPRIVGFNPTKIFLHRVSILAILVVEILASPLPRRSQTKLSKWKGCGSKPNYCCDSQKFNEPFGDLTRSLILKINAWRAKHKNTCSHTCVLKMQKVGKQPSSYNKVDRRLVKYASKFKAIYSKLSDDSVFKKDIEDLLQAIEKRRNESLVCQKRKSHNKSYKFLSKYFDRIKVQRLETLKEDLNQNKKTQKQVLNRNPSHNLINDTIKKRNRGFKWNQRSSTIASLNGESFGYKFEESNGGCCTGVEAKEWSYMVIADHFLIRFNREFETRY